MSTGRSGHGDACSTGGNVLVTGGTLSGGDLVARSSTILQAGRSVPASGRPVGPLPSHGNAAQQSESPGLGGTGSSG